MKLVMFSEAAADACRLLVRTRHGRRRQSRRRERGISSQPVAYNGWEARDAETWDTSYRFDALSGCLPLK